MKKARFEKLDTIAESWEVSDRTLVDRPLFQSIVEALPLTARYLTNLVSLGRSSVLLKATIQMSACTMEAYRMIGCCARRK